MLSEDRYFKDFSKAELWRRYCGFLDLSIDEFMDIQEELLLDQIERVADSVLGKKIMNNKKPKSVDEFRRMVPLTTYDDYEPYLSEQREDVLAIKPHLWCHSAGRGGRFKWVPHSSEFLEKVTKSGVGSLILATASQKGQVNISLGFRFLVALPPVPYASGWLFQTAAEHLSFRAIPPLRGTEGMGFQERIMKGFQITLKDGVDIIGAIASILVKMGEEFSGQAQSMKFSAYMLHPRIIGRLLRAWFHSKREKRTILPRDLWPTKAIMTGGVDTAIYKDDIAYYWGCEPYEFYVCAEAFFVAVQNWNRKGMVFFPDIVFLEFIPYEEQLKHQDDKSYQPSTVLLSEVEEGKLYEVVITQLYGMPLLRYRMKDLVRVIALRDDQTGVNLPQIVFQHRIGETINLAGLVDLDEKTIWQAIANTRIKYTDWLACKEYERNQSFLRLYLELKEEREATEVEAMIDEQLKIVDLDYRDIDSYLALQPVRISFLSPGTFQRYMEEKRREGADLAHLKPTHVNPPEAAVQRMLQLSELGKENDKSSV
jgi:hypothetical protein